jgi:TPP-dependent 2-oxoacid decarboxylase
LEWDGKLEFAHSDTRNLEEAVRETTEWFNRARKPAVIVGIETFRFKLQKEIVELVEKMGAPCMSTVLAKGAFPMDHPQYMGVNIGPISPPPIRKRIDEADLVINLGTLLTDMNLGSRLPSCRKRNRFGRYKTKSILVIIRTPTSPFVTTSKDSSKHR